MSIYLTPLSPQAGAAIELPEDLLWTDELTWSRVQQSTERGIWGTLIVDVMERHGGRPITLTGGGNSAWILRATLKRLAALMSVPGQRLLLDIRGEQFEVIFDHGTDESTHAIAMEDVVDYSDKEDADFYCSLVLRFLEASEAL